MPPDDPPHSADQFGAQRDYWWNPDFLQLMAQRWRLREVADAVDVGCGVGHWSRVLYPFLGHAARLTGIDREARWVAEAAVRFRAQFPAVPADRFRFLQGDAGRLPLPDACCDLATCQTVLMHLARPREALREMRRILRPGGLLLCVEPNNLWNCLAMTSLTAAEPVEFVLLRHELFLRTHRGRIAAGDGDHAVGDLLPGWFAELGLSEIQVHTNDRCAALFPPYDSPAQRALAAESAAVPDSPWNREQFRNYWRLGGGGDGGFDRAFDAAVQAHRAEVAAVGAGKFHAAFPSQSTIVSGRKP